MRNILKFFIAHPTIVNLCVLLIVALGLLSFLSTQTRFFPVTKERFVDIAVPYPGATPEEVEEGVLLKIEEELQGIEGIDRLLSTASPSIGRVEVELTEDALADKTLALVKNAVDKINDFPRGVESPVVEKRDIKDLAMAIALTGDISLQQKKDYADKIEEDLLAMQGISDVIIGGTPKQEIEITLSESALRNYNLSFQQVSQAVAAANLETFGGELKTRDANINIKANNKGYYAKDLEGIIVSARPDGSVLYLRDVATIHDQFKDDPGQLYLDGQQAVTLTVFATTKENILDNAAKTLDYAERFNRRHEGIQLTVIENGSESVNDNISTMTSNGLAGFVLVLIVLALFLDKYLAFWVALKIPVAIIGMFILSGIWGMTINVVSLFAFVIVLGILVDDGVVIGENIYQWAKKKGKSPNEAAVEGTMEMVVPVLISLSTTAVAFSMFMFLPTQTGEYFGEMAFVVIAVLVIAVLESFFFLPAHLAHSKALRADSKPTKIEKWFNGLIDWLNNKVYQPVFRGLITKRGWTPYLALVAFIAALFGTFGLMGSGVVGFTFFPNLDDKAVFIEMDMPPGTPTEVTLANLEKIRLAANRANEKTGEEFGQEMIEFVEVITGPRSNQGKLKVTYVNSDKREISSFDLTDRIRAEAPEFPEADNVVYGIGATTAVFGKPVSIAIRGSNLENLRDARDQLRAAMADRSDLKDVSDTDQQGVREINLSLLPVAERLGLNLAGVMNQVRTAFFGSEVQSVQRGDEEVEIWVRYPRDERTSENSLADMRIQTPNGGSYPLREIARLDYGTANQVIKRLEGQREIRVEANVASIDVSAPTALGELQAGVVTDLMQQYPDLAFTAEGQSRESEKMGGGAAVVFPVILLIMLALIVINFNSFSQAILTFALYPFAFIGVILGHYIQGEALNVFSIIGTIALIGVFTNNSLVLISTFNQLLEEGKEFFAALKEATASRFRPILLTTVTTVAGLAPLLASGSLPAQFLKGPAIAMAYGLSFGLFNVLFLLPALLVIVNQGRRLKKRILTRGKRKITGAEVEPAVRAKAYQF
ncbi:MAG: efflux RND transporter permease subunit [Bacteroidota bacterium]